MLFQWVLLKLSAEQKTVKLLWVAYLSFKLITMSLYFFICLQIVLMFKSLTPQIDGWQITLNTNI
jgi:hypothetical protein